MGAIAVVVGLRLAVKKYRLLPTVLMASMAMQALAITGIPAAVLFVRWRGPQQEEKPFQREPISFAWLPNSITSAAFAALGVVVWIVRSSLDEPDLWKFAEVLQVVSFLPLVLKVAAARNIAGISAKTLILDVLWLTCRLVATSMLDLKLPRKSGNSVVMTIDAISLTASVYVLLSTLLWRRHSYQASSDSFPVWPLLLGAVVLAASVRANMSQRFLPDFLFTASLYVDAFAMVPQLWLVAQNSGVADVAVTHHIASMFVSRLMGLNFWWLIRGHWHQGMRFTGWLILVVYTVHVLLLCHFMCYYLKALCTRGPFSNAPLLCAES